MRQQFIGFVIRWLLTVLGFWLAVKVFGTGYGEKPEEIKVFFIAGFVFSVVNTLLRPIIVILSLPALLLTLGLFMLVVNGILVYIAIVITPGLSMTFVNSILTGIVISLVNYIMSNVIELKYTRPREETL